jgi:hypothetical protein
VVNRGKSKDAGNRENAPDNKLEIELSVMSGYKGSNPFLSAISSIRIDLTIVYFPLFTIFIFALRCALPIFVPVFFSKASRISAATG